MEGTETAWKLKKEKHLICYSKYKLAAGMELLVQGLAF